MHVLKSLFSTTTRNWIATQLNENVKRNSTTAIQHGAEFNAENVLEITLTFFLTILEPSSSWTTFRDNKDRRGVKKRMLDRFIKHLNLPWKQLFENVNRDFKQCVHAGGKATGDETMWGWQGDDISAVHLERKPIPDGFKVLTLSVEMTRTKR